MADTGLKHTAFHQCSRKSADFLTSIISRKKLYEKTEIKRININNGHTLRVSVCRSTRFLSNKHNIQNKEKEEKKKTARKEYRNTGLFVKLLVTWSTFDRN
jgi:hypothetical protein